MHNIFCDYVDFDINFHLKQNIREVPAGKFSTFPRVEFNSTENGKVLG